MKKNSPDLQQPGLHIDQQVDMLEYLFAILNAKYRIVLLAILVAGAVFGFSVLIPDKFSATSVLAVNINENPGGVAPKTYRGNDALGLLEHDFIIDATPANELDRLLARLRSHSFVQSFIEKHNLLPLLFPTLWSAETESWVDSAPDLREAVNIFKSSYLSIRHDESNGLLFISFTTLDPVFSAELANIYSADFNAYVRTLELNQLTTRRLYLENRLSEVQNMEVHRSIYRLLEAQLAVESLLYARENYPLEAIQPAMVPLFKSYPSRKKWTVLAFFAVIFLGIFTVVAWVILKKIRSGLAAYSVRQGGNNSAGAPAIEVTQGDAEPGSRDGWVK
jgi:uncharacterized protein involved in exopolysaccharide biosynthesis